MGLTKIGIPAGTPSVGLFQKEMVIWYGKCSPFTMSTCAMPLSDSVS